MRTIKFRGWHSRMNRIISPEELGADQITLLPSTGQFINVSGDSTFLSTIYPFDKFIPMQFTGLHDKNGKEIYEGDIVEITLANGEGKQRGPIVFDQERGRFGMSDGETVWGLTSGDKANEVIGNIHEIPELLK